MFFLNFYVTCAVTIVRMKKEKIELEFIFRASPSMLYDFVSSEEGLARWFCDEVVINRNKYEFYWDGSVEKATLVDYEEDSKVVFKWDDANNENTYLEFYVYRSPITNDTVLRITDFSYDDEVEDQIELWESQIDELRDAIGC